MSWPEGTLWIGGEWTAPESDKTLLTLNPATGGPLARLAEAGARDVAKAVEAARAAFPAWARRTPQERGRLLLRLATRVEQESDRIARLTTLDNGLPIRVQRRLIQLAVHRLIYYAGNATQVQGETIPTPGETLDYTLWEPFGVVGIIIPWNASILFAAARMAPALVAGNTVILKPAEQASLGELELGRLAGEIFPPGTLNILTGAGPTAGAALVGHPGVAKLSFTGSRQTGKWILQTAAQHLAPVTLELGGKSPNIVFPDADLDRALEGAFQAMALEMSAGQTCFAGTRLFLHRSIAARFIERLVDRFRSIRLGNPLEETTRMGPLISREQMERVLGYIEAGRQEGAQLLCGGGRPADPALREGFFVEPTLFRARNSMRICQEEIFGPVLSVLEWEDEEAMIEEANAVPYGLAAGIWTRDLATAHRTAARLEAGYIWINHYGHTFTGTPFGGYKESGIGRVSDARDVFNYMQKKNINLKLD